MDNDQRLTTTGWVGRGARQRSGCGSRSLLNGRLKKTQSPKPGRSGMEFSGDPRLLGVIWEVCWGPGGRCGALTYSGVQRVVQWTLQGVQAGTSSLRPEGAWRACDNRCRAMAPRQHFTHKAQGTARALLQGAVKQSQHAPVLLSQPAAHPRGPLSPLNGRRPGGQRAVAQRRWGRHLGGTLLRRLAATH